MKPTKSKNPDWTEKEIQILKKEYPIHGTDIPALKRTKTSISSKAHLIGLKKLPNWTEEEISILMEKYPANGADIPELLNKTKKEIYKKAHKLKIQVIEKTKINSRIGMTKKAKNGQMMTIIGYNNVNDMTVKFEDKTIVEHVNYSSFEKGNVKNPNYTHKDSIKNKKKKEYIGKTNKAANGQMMTIIDYKDTKHVTIQFEDGTVVVNTMNNFNLGKVKNPNFTYIDAKHKMFKDKYIGMTTTATNGQKMTIIEYRISSDIDVEFEDGTIVQHMSLSTFNLGNIENPNYTVYQKKIEDNGKIRTWNNYFLKNGLSAKIIHYHNNRNLEIEMEDGTRVEHVSLSNLCKGNVKHPTLHPIYKTKSTYNDFNCRFITYKKEERKAYYECTCTVCGLKDIMTPQEMMKHKHPERKQND